MKCERLSFPGIPTSYFEYIRRQPLYNPIWWSHECLIVLNITYHPNNSQMYIFSFKPPPWTHAPVFNCLLYISIWSLVDTLNLIYSALRFWCSSSDLPPVFVLLSENDNSVLLFPWPKTLESSWIVLFYIPHSIFQQMLLVLTTKLYP